jgi:hypothetical protein
VGGGETMHNAIDTGMRPRTGETAMSTTRKQGGVWISSLPPDDLKIDQREGGGDPTHRVAIVVGDLLRELLKGNQIRR